MDELVKLLRPEVLAAMVLCPIGLQYVRRFFPAFAKEHAAVANFAVVVGIVLWVLRAQWLHPTPESVLMTLTQAAVAWVVSDMWFTKGVEPMAKSSNPVMPSASNGGST